MRIIIADDHTMFAEGLKNLLESRGHSVAAIAADGLQAFELAKKHNPDVMLIDIYMPKCDGLEAAALIKTRLPGIKIIMLTSSENRKDIFEAIKAGACGYFLKSLESEKLFRALNVLGEGGMPVSPGIAGDILEEFKKGKMPPKRGEGLTERQIEVLSLVAAGLNYNEIAEKLFVTERTVRYHVESAIDKLHLQNREQLLSYGIKAGIIK